MRSVIFGLLLLIPVVVGCGQAKGKVSGRVLVNGKPLPGGRLAFRPVNPKFNSVPAVVDEQGNYEVVLPVGEVKVSVDNRSLAPRKPRPTGVPNGLPPKVKQTLSNAKAAPTEAPPANDASEKSSSKYVPIPSNYYDTEKSGLQLKVEIGDQKHDIELRAGR